jgi:hypothetical protein
MPDPLPMIAGQFRSESGRWLLPPTTPITQDWHGAPVLATADGALVGFVVADGTTQHVQPISETLASKVQGK